MKIIALLGLVLLSGCQTVTFKEYDPKTGNLIKDYKREGVPNWSNNKDISLPISVVGV